MSQNIFRCVLFAFLAVALAGCSAAPTITPLPSPMQVNTNTPVIPTATPVIPTALPATATLVSTPTPLPTLSAEEATNKLLELLGNNGGCRLPCLWGITPGESTVQDAQVVLSQLSNIQNEYSFDASFDPVKGKGYVDPFIANGDQMLHVSAQYSSEKQLINYIDFYARAEKRGETSNGEKGWFYIFDSETFGKRTQYYSLANVLSEQGLPDSVMIATSNLPGGGSGGFYIWLVYSKQGILVKYTFEAHGIEGDVRGCPAYAHVEMDLYPAGNAEAFYAFLEQKQDWTIQKDWRKPIEEVTSMTLNEFYETFRNPTDKCIETPANLWSTPESGGG